MVVFIKILESHKRKLSLEIDEINKELKKKRTSIDNEETKTPKKYVNQSIFDTMNYVIGMVAAAVA